MFLGGLRKFCYVFAYNVVDLPIRHYGTLFRSFLCTLLLFLQKPRTEPKTDPGRGSFLSIISSCSSAFLSDHYVFSASWIDRSRETSPCGPLKQPVCSSGYIFLGCESLNVGFCNLSYCVIDNAKGLPCNRQQEEKVTPA